MFALIMLLDTAYLNEVQLAPILCESNHISSLILFKSLSLFKHFGNVEEIQIDTFKFTFQTLFNVNILIMVSILSIGFSVDLIRTIRNPFEGYKFRKRLTYILLFIVLIITLSYIAILNRQVEYLDIKEQYSFLVFPWLVIIGAIELGIVIYSLYVSSERL